MDLDGSDGAEGGPSIDELLQVMRRGRAPTTPSADPLDQLSDWLAARRWAPNGGLFGSGYAQYMAANAPPLPTAPGSDPTVLAVGANAGPSGADFAGVRQPQVQPAVWSGGALPLDDGVYRPTDPQPQVWPAASPQRSAGAQAHVGGNGYHLYDTAQDARGRIASAGAAFGIRGVLDPKCNQFVWDALTAVGQQPGRLNAGRIPRAEDWGDPRSKIAGYKPVQGPLQPGDVISNGHHVGLYAPLAGGRPGTISAATPFHNAGIAGGVVHNDWGFRGDQGAITAWRYLGRP